MKKKNKNISFPDAPGVYFFKNSDDQVIYIGKAKSLKKRIQSYFNASNPTEKSLSLMHEYAAIEFIVTKNEYEALLLEAQLIKQHQPKYNISLKEGQPYLYILFTSTDLPTMELVRTQLHKGRYVGPFLHKRQARSVYSYLKKTFRLSLCNKTLENGCLQYHIGLCAGNCTPDFDKKGYILRLNLAYDTLTKNRTQFLKRLKEHINQYNKEHKFEQSKQLSNYANNIETIFATLATKFSAKKFEDTVFSITTPKKHLTDNYEQTEQKLRNLLNMQHPIKTIDCFDISHFQSRSLVGSCVRFTSGRPDKNNFRRFRIKTLSQQNDYAALQEIVNRRYKEADFLPDLILIDGGKGQLSAVMAVAPDVPIISLAKREETIYSSTLDDEVKLDLHSPAAQLLIALRDYAHHFAISYHKLKRSKSFLP